MARPEIYECLRRDVSWHYSTSHVDRRMLAKAILNPSILAAQLFRLASRTTGISHTLFRWLLIVIFSCDVASGARFIGAIDIPHPTGIVIGRGVQIGDRCRIYQNVTIGSAPNGRYPILGEGVTLYCGAVVAGALRVGNDATIGANATVTRDLTAGSTARSQVPRC